MEARGYCRSQALVKTGVRSRFCGSWIARSLLATICCVVAIDQPLNAFADQPENPFEEPAAEAFPARTLKLKLLAAQEPDLAPQEPEPKPAPATLDDGPAPDTGARLFRTAIPAGKMTLRRDPRKDRFIGNDSENGKSLRAVQEELQRNEQRNVYANMAVVNAEEGWSMDVPYGKYIYVHHSPLIFEDIPLERYGDEIHPALTPVVSFTKFMGTVGMLPYKVTTNIWASNHDCALYSYDYQGNVRPGILEGSWLPRPQVIREYPVANMMGLFAEAGVITGFLIIP